MTPELIALIALVTPVVGIGIWVGTIQSKVAGQASDIDELKGRADSGDMWRQRTDQQVTKLAELSEGINRLRQAHREADKALAEQVGEIRNELHAMAVDVAELRTRAEVSREHRRATYPPT